MLLPMGEIVTRKRQIMRILFLLMLALPAVAQVPQYDYAVPMAMTSFANNEYTVTTTSSTAVPYVDYAAPFFPVCWNQSLRAGVGAYAACVIGGGSGPITLSGDATGTGTSTVPVTLNTVGSAQTVGDASHVAQVTTNAKGLVTGMNSVVITPVAIGAATVAATLQKAANLSDISSRASAQINLGVGFHLNAYATVSPQSCSSSALPAAGCSDQTSAIQAAIDAAHAAQTTLYIDSAGAGNCFLASQLTFYRGSKIVGDSFLYGAGSSFCQVAGTNKSFLVSDPSVAGSSYMDSFDLGGFSIVMNNGISSAGAAIELDSRMGELSKIHDISIGPAPADGILLTRGADPALIENVGGYQIKGAVVHLTKTGADPWNRVVLNNVAADNAGDGAVHISTGSGVASADNFTIGAVKVETRMDNTSVPQGTPYAVWLDNLNGSSVNIGNLNLVQVGASASITSITASGCTGATCTATVSYSGTGLVPPSIGDSFGISGNASYSSQSCTVTAASSGSVTCTESTTASNGTVSGGTAYWNRKTQAAIKISGSVVKLYIANLTAEGGTNNQGLFGYSNVISDSYSAWTTDYTDIADGNSGVGFDFVNGNYTSGVRDFSYDHGKHVNQSIDDNEGDSFRVHGDAYPRTRVTPYGVTLGNGLIAADASLQRTGVAEIGVAWINHQYGGMQLTHAYSPSGNYSFGSTYSLSWQVDNSSGAMYPTGSYSLGTTANPVAVFASLLTSTGALLSTTYVKAPTIASPTCSSTAAATIVPTCDVLTLLGSSTTISTMTPPNGISGAAGAIDIVSLNNQTISNTGGSGAGQFYAGFTLSANTPYHCVYGYNSTTLWYCK